MFALRGPEFLLLFAALAIVVFVLVDALIETREGRLPSYPQIRDPYAIAYLRGDTRELMRVVALSLCLRGLLKVGTSTFRTVSESEIERAQIPVEKQVLLLCRAGCTPPALEGAPGFVAAVAAYHGDLIHRGLLADGNVKLQRWPAALLGSTVLVAIAAFKIHVALATGHSNILFLILLTGAAVLLLARRAAARRTSSGNAVLRNLTTLFRSLRSQRAPKSAGGPKSGGGVSEAALLAAVFGIYGVAGLDRLSWAKMFPKPGSSNSSDGGSGCSGGCGGGGCGGCGS